MATKLIIELENRFEMMNTTISTLCPSLDNLLHYGIKSKAITFITGPRASGKTQFCLQLAFALQLDKPTETKRTLYFQPHRLYPTNRLKGVSNAVLNYLKSNLDALSDEDTKHRVQECDVVKSVHNTIFLYSHAGHSILDMINTLPEIVRRQNIKLIIVDNIEEQIFSGNLKKDDALSTFYPRILRLLHIIAYTNDIAVVITSTKKSSNISIPYHNMTIKLEELSKFQVNLLHLYDDIFQVEVCKSPVIHFITTNERSIKIKITTRGVYDLKEEQQKKDDDSETELGSSTSTL